MLANESLASTMFSVALTMQPPDMFSIMSLVRLDCYVSWDVRCSYQHIPVRAFLPPDSSLDRSKFRSHTDYDLVHHLPHADLIMVLGANGQAIKQGSYTELRDHADNLSEMHGIKLTRTDETERIDELESPSNYTADSISAPSPDVHRQTTDLAVYKYYFSALGWFRIVALLLFLITEAGISAFRCELQLYPP